MIIRKSTAEIETMANAGRVVADTIALIGEHLRPGVTTGELDELADDYIRAQGGTSSFKGYRGYPASICTSPNDMVVHGIPGRRALEDGDILSVDVGVILDGFVADSAHTFPVGEISDLALFRVRPMFATLPGVSAPPPFGGNQRTIVLHVDPDKLREYRMSPDEVVKAVSKQNLIMPSGTVRVFAAASLTEALTAERRPLEARLGAVSVSYAFAGSLYTTCVATSGVQIDFSGGTCTATQSSPQNLVWWSTNSPSPDCPNPQTFAFGAGGMPQLLGRCDDHSQPYDPLHWQWKITAAE